jgi:hypothetical protein
VALVSKSRAWRHRCTFASLVLASLGWIVASERLGVVSPARASRLWTSAHFIYESRANDDSVCPSILDTLERHRAAVTAFLGIPGPATPIRYLKFRNRFDLVRSGHCSPESAACFFANVGIETHQRFEKHELIHAYLAPLGDSHKLLEEGVAEAFSCGVDLPISEHVGWKAAFDADVWRNSDISERRHLYRAGSWFVGHLLHHFPPATFVRLYQAVKPSDDPARVAAVFREIYQQPLDDTWNDALASSDPNTACIHAYECTAPTWQQAPLESWRQACDASDEFRSIVASEPLAVLERVEQYAAALLRCDARKELPYASSLRAGQRSPEGGGFSTVLEPGHYAISATEAKAEIGVEAAEKYFASPADCSELESLRTDGALQVLFATSGALGSVLHPTGTDSLTGHELTTSLPTAAAGPPQAAGAISWMVAWEDSKFREGKLHIAECSPNLELWACSSCSVDDCQQLCDRDVRGKAFPMGAGVQRFRGRSTEDVWFRVRRAVR